jgi:hypothetical protein
MVLLIAQPIPTKLVSKPSETYKGGYKSNISKVTACIWKIVQKEWFPKVHPSGCVYLVDYICLRMKCKS